MADETKVKRLYVSGNLKGPIRVDVDCLGAPKTLSVEDNTIYNVTNCSKLTISLPTDAPYAAYLFVEFSSDASVEGFVFPDGASIFGTNPESAGRGELWEISIDSTGGILCLRKTAYG